MAYYEYRTLIVRGIHRSQPERDLPEDQII